MTPPDDPLRAELHRKADLLQRTETAREPLIKLVWLADVHAIIDEAFAALQQPARSEGLICGDCGERIALAVPGETE